MGTWLFFSQTTLEENVSTNSFLQVKLPGFDFSKCIKRVAKLSLGIYVVFFCDLFLGEPCQLSGERIHIPPFTGSSENHRLKKCHVGDTPGSTHLHP